MPVPQAFEPGRIHGADRRVRGLFPDIVDQAPLGIAILRADRAVAFVNEALRRSARLDGPVPPRGWVLPALRRLDGRPFPDDQDPVDEVLASGRPQSARPALVVRADGTSFEARVSATPIVDAMDVVMGVVVYVDASAADDDDRTLREVFIGVLSHELRTPITSIYGGTQLLLGDRMSADNRATVVSDIAAEAEQLHRLVEDLLAIARTERGVADITREPVLVQHLATEAARAEERRSPGQRVQVEVAGQVPAACADDGYTTQVLRNLIANAVKYGPLDQPVVVSVSAADDEVRVAVLDRGPGFPPETGPDAFRLFYRSPAVAAHVAGTGIGLFVARTLVEAQGGRVWLRNRRRGGAEVGFALPRYEPDGADRGGL